MARCVATYLCDKMNTFGNTNLGYEEPIKDYLRCDYKEPTYNDPIPYERHPGATPAQTGEKRFVVPEKIDCYLSYCDGYSHDSRERLHYQRMHHLRKPVGPLDMYRRPICTSMDIAWHLDDPFLQGERGDWLKVTPRYPTVTTDVSRFVDEARKKDRQFFM